MFNALMGTIFLVLVATSAAVTGSMIVLALFDLAFGKKVSGKDATDNEYLSVLLAIHNGPVAKS